MATGSEIKTGCCGFALSQQEYFRTFSLIEIQQTFYQLPRLQTAENWRRKAPEAFEFTIKAWQLITHEPSSPTYRRLGFRIGPDELERYGRFRPTGQVLKAWEQTASFARQLGATVIVFQCPASFRPTEDNVTKMVYFFKEVDRHGLRFAWEPRGRWPQELIHGLCRDLALIHCVDPFRQDKLYGDIQYFRLHGLTGYAYRYTDEELLRLRGWAEKKATYVLFNNNWMKDDALRFIAMQGSSGP
jgi:uncharacterized protein YecE (DUF72 family)